MKFLLGYKAFCLGLLLLALSNASGHTQVLRFDQAKQRADAGDAFAQAVVALHYQLGWNTEKNAELAARYAVASANAGDPYGQFRLGALLRAGEGVPKDEQQGLAYQAASFDGLDQMTGDPYALTALGVMIFQGKVVAENVPQEKRRQQAAQLYKRAADAGFAPAQFNYAMCAEAGHGMPKDIRTSLRYLGKARDGEFPAALERELSLESMPEISPSIANSVLNPETYVWEPADQEGYSSEWHDVIPPSAAKTISVAVRPNYTEFPAYVSDSEWTFDILHYSADTQSLFNSWQHVVSKTEGGALEISLPVAPRDKNILSITEYPISLEWRITNLSDRELRLNEFLLEVVEADPIKEAIPAAFPTAAGLLRTHNFGWGKSAGVKLDLGLYLDPIDGSNDSPRPLVRTASLVMPDDFISSKTLAELFGLTPSAYRDISVPDGVPAPSSVSVLTCLTTSSGKEQKEEEVHRALALTGDDDPIRHNRFPSDLQLPSNKANYVVRFPANLSIAPGGSTQFIINFTTDQSTKLRCRPAFTFDDGMKVEGQETWVRSEVVRPLPEFPPRQHLTTQGQDHESYAATIAGADMYPFAYDRVRRKAGAASREEEELLIEKEINALKQMETAAAALPRLRASNQSLPLPAVFAERVRPETSRLGIDGWLCGFEAVQQGDFVLGSLEVVDAQSQSPVSQIRWAFPGKQTEFTLQLTGSQGHGWIAWRAASNSGSKLYVAFPGLSDCAWFLPCVDEETIERITRSEDGRSLVVKTGDAVVEVDLTSGLVRSALRALTLGVVQSHNVVATGEDIDSLMRVRLALTSKTAHDLSHSAVEKVVKVAPEEQMTKNTGLAWITPTTVGVWDGARWSVWDLLRGAVFIASSAEAQRCEEVRKEQASKIQKLGSETLDSSYEAELKQGCWSLWPGWAAEVRLTKEKKIRVLVDRGSYYGPRNLFNVTLRELESEPRRGLSERLFMPQRSVSVVLGNSANLHAPVFTGAKALSLSPAEDKLVLASKDGTELFFVDLSRMASLARAVVSPNNPEIVTVVSGNYYLSGNGTADGVALVNLASSVPISRFESKFNRPDIVLERLGADESLIKEAKRLRERLVRRSDFKSFDGATLIDIPVVAVTSEVPEQTGKKSLSLDFEASNSTGPLKELRVFNNGALVKTLELKGKDGQPSREAAGEVEIDLASGENRLQLMAVSEEGFTSSFAEKRVNCTAEPDSRRCFIAAVGVSEYNDPRFNLKFAAKDAEDMSKALAEKARHRGYQPEVLVVKNAEVDSGLVDKLREFLSQAGTDDEVVLFFAGHGLLDKDLEYHFARHDTDFDATENMGITFEALESLVDGIKPLKRTVLFDTCHSGEVEEEDKPQLLAMVGSADLSPAAAADSGVQVRGVATRGMKVTGTEPKLRHSDFVELEGLFPDSRRAKGANILTSSSGSEFSMESDAWQNGLFTYAFLNALQDEKTDANSDKTVSFNEAATAVQDKVKTLSGGNQRPITRGVNREAEVTLASFGPPVEPIPTKEKKSGWWPF